MDALLILSLQKKHVFQQRNQAGAKQQQQHQHQYQQQRGSDYIHLPHPDPRLHHPLLLLRCFPLAMVTSLKLRTKPRK